MPGVNLGRRLRGQTTRRFTGRGGDSKSAFVFCAEEGGAGEESAGATVISEVSLGVCQNDL
jgi:hypothetical protein